MLLKSRPVCGALDGFLYYGTPQDSWRIPYTPQFPSKILKRLRFFCPSLSDRSNSLCIRQMTSTHELATILSHEEGSLKQPFL